MQNTRGGRQKKQEAHSKTRKMAGRGAPHRGEPWANAKEGRPKRKKANRNTRKMAGRGLRSQRRAGKQAPRDK